VTFDSQTQHTRNIMLMVFICTLLELFSLLWYVHQDKGDILPISEDDNQLQKIK